MAKTKISEFSSTPANNTDIDSINIAEGCAPSGINDAIRELMAQLKDFQTGAQGDSFNGPIGTSTAAAGAFTTLSATGAITSTLATGTAPLVIASTTKVANLNVDLLDGADWASPAALGSTTPAAVSATTLSASGAVTLSGGTANGVAYLNGSKVVTSGSALTFNGTSLTIDGGTAGYLYGPAGELMIGEDASGLYIGNGGGGVPAIPILFGSTATTYQRFNAGGSEQMRLTSTGLGIGTSSPSSKLDIVGVTQWQATAGTVLGKLTYSGGEPVVLANTGLGLQFFTNNAFAAKIDSSGNLGLGVTPSAWSGYKAFQVGVGSADGAFIAAGNDTNVTTNAYFNAGWKYQTSSNLATMYKQTSGTHQWHTAPSGTAGNAITFTQAMSLDADGNWILGNTSNASFGTVRAYIESAGATVAMKATGGASSIPLNVWNTASSGTINLVLFYTGAGTSPGSITSNGTTTSYNTSSDYRLKNITGSITTSGAYIDSLNPVEGTWKADGSTFVGLIAHEVQEASRTQVATGTKDGAEMQAMDYSNSELIANLIAEVKSLRKRLADAGL